MKKYLIKGALALSICFIFTSCKDDNVEYVPVAQQKTQAYASAFKELIGGNVDPNQDWGFEKVTLPSIDDLLSGRARTRAGGDFASHVGAYPDANMWTSNGFLAPRPLYAGQKARVQYYFQKNQITNPNRPDNGTIDFFMQQVYDGGTDPLTNYYSGYSPEKYLAADNNTLIESGEHMDHLTAGPNNLHIYNFNNGNCSTNYNVANRDQTDVNDTGQQHQDEIMLMLNTPTDRFGYANSDASCVRTDRWTLVSGSDIDNFCDNDPNFADWLSGKGIADVKVVDEFNRSFIGFDFDQIPDWSVFAGDNVYASNGWQVINKTYQDYHYFTFDDNRYHYVEANQNQYCGDFVEWTSDDMKTDENIRQKLADGYLPVYNSNVKKWVKVGGCADGYYSDWIVSFMPANSGEGISGGGSSSETTETTYERVKAHFLAGQGRVFCEDLGKVTRADIDFNDVVFDARIWWTFEYDRWIEGGVIKRIDNYGPFKYEAELSLLAAGGTIPSKVIYQDVHGLFEVGETTMVNTVDGNSDVTVTWDNSSATHDPVYLTYDMTDIVNDAKAKAEAAAAETGEPVKISLIDLIPVEAMWTTSDPEDTYQGMKTVGVLEAKVGEAPHKISLPIGTIWPSERISIVDAYDGFENWAKNRSSNPDFNLTPDVNSLYANAQAGLPQDAKYTVNADDIWGSYNYEVVLSTSSSSTTVTETTLWESTFAFNDEETGSNAEITLYSSDFNVGDVLRIYVSNVGSDARMTFKNQDWLDIFETGISGEYVDIPITIEYKNAIKANTKIWGRRFTMTKISKVVTVTN